MDNREIVELLNEDIRGEHGAIILYLRIAFALGEGEMASEIEEIARDEMRHYKWLAQEVVRLGGEPTTEREEIDAETTDPLSLMRHTIEREQGAADQYAAHADAIGDPRIGALLGRITVDEQHHHEMFARMIEKLEQGIVTPEEHPEAPPAAAVEPLQQDVELEYTTLLQYLHQSFLTPDCPLGRDLEDQAIIEMKHMGWLAEYLAEAGAIPRLEHAAIDASADPVEILETNIRVEIGVEDTYQRQLAAAEDPKLKKVLRWILDHSVYHEEHFRELLSEVQARRSAQAAPTQAEEKPTTGGWTVGSLLGRPQA